MFANKAKRLAQVLLTTKKATEKKAWIVPAENKSSKIVASTFCPLTPTGTPKKHLFISIHSVLRYAPSDRCLQPLKVGRPLGLPSHSVLSLEDDAMYDDPVKAAVAALAIIVVVDVDRNTLRNIFRWNVTSDCLVYYHVY